MATNDAAIERARARIGSVVDGKWHLDALLGVGGMAAVYAATHRNRTRAAIKILNPDIALNADAKARFLREGYVANNIEHPRVVLVQDDDEAPDGTVYLVMELLEGQTLQSILADGKKLPVTQVLRIAHDVLDVLEAAHAKEIIHRDLKPGNLLIGTDGRVKVLDFGVAKVRESTVTGIPNVTTLSPMGTPGFMAPEQARGRWDSVDGRADIWALGATMFALLTCRYVHEEETPNEQFLAAMTKPAPAIRELLPELDAEVAAIVDRALAFDREQRFRNATEMKAAVAAALAAHESPVSTKEEKPAGASDDADRSGPVATAPITGGASVSDVAAYRPATAGRKSFLFIGLGVLALGLIAFALRKSPSATQSGDEPTRTSTSVTSTPNGPEPSVTQAAVAPAPAPAPAPAGELDASVSEKIATPMRPAQAKDRDPKPAETKPLAATPRPNSAPREAPAPPAASPPPPPPAPSASVDIFNRRR